MNELNQKTRVSDEKCPHCGTPITYGYIQQLDQEFRITCPCKERERAQQITAGKEIIREHLREVAGINRKQRRFRIEKITPRTGQQSAYNAVRSFVEQFRKNPHAAGLLLIGGVGSGKTMLAAAIANAVIDLCEIDKHEAERAGQGIQCNDTRTPVRFTSTVDLFSRLKADFKDNSAQRITDRLKRTPLLILDDLGAEKPSTWIQERLFEIIDYRYNAELPIIVTTNAIPTELKAQIGDRSFDRLREMCEQITVDGKSQRKTAQNPKRL